MNKAHVVKYLLEIRASYWFIPTLMVIASIGLSVLTVWLDGQVSADWPSHVPLIFSNKPDGARALLATVAGSMITVAGVTFSLTLLAVSHATAQFGPRLLNNFMRDRGNQITLGTFVSTFIYCLLVLRTVRTAEEPPHGKEVVEGLTAAFVPHISVTVALVMTLCSVGVLIYFIHHVPESIRLSNVVSNVGMQLQTSLKTLFPESIAESEPETCEVSKDRIVESFFDECTAVSLDTSGYIQSIDEEGLLRVSKELDLTVFVKHRPGDFYCEGTDLVLVGRVETLADEDANRIRGLFAVGNHRTVSQNSMFAVDQLVEVAQRALSPGVNDPATAMHCIDWLKVGLVELSRRKSPSVFRYDEEDNLRIFSREIGFEDFCERAFGQLRQYVAEDRNTSQYTMKTIKAIQTIASTDAQRAALARQADRLLATFEQHNYAEFDVAVMRQLNQQSDADFQRVSDPRSTSSG